MSNQTTVPPEEVNRLYNKLRQEAESAGYHLNPDVETTKELVKGLLVNEKRYGYWSCPCRLASRKQEEDRDIICPCDYRDPDLTDYSTCYCNLYVTQEVVDGMKKIGPIPERRLTRSMREKAARGDRKTRPAPLPLPVWHCRVCGYLCAREAPPEVCPICKAKRDRFERFL